MADWPIPLTSAVLSRLCHARFERLLCVVCALHRLQSCGLRRLFWIRLCLSLPPLEAAAIAAGAPVDFMDCFHAYAVAH